MAKRAGEIEKAIASAAACGSPPPSQPPAKVGFAAIQEMARRQEEALLKGDDLGSDAVDSPVKATAGGYHMRFDPEANCLKLETEEEAAKSSLPVPIAQKEKTTAGLGRFPLEVSPSPTQSPPSRGFGLRRAGSYRLGTRKVPLVGLVLTVVTVATNSIFSDDALFP